MGRVVVEVRTRDAVAITDKAIWVLLEKRETAVGPVLAKKDAQTDLERFDAAFASLPPSQTEDAVVTPKPSLEGIEESLAAQTQAAEMLARAQARRNDLITLEKGSESWILMERALDEVKGKRWGSEWLRNAIRRVECALAS